MAQTLDQQRAALAWGYATAAMKTGFAKKYKNLAKGAPALIMNSGLMPTLAFYNSKDPEHKALLEDLLAGLSTRLKPSPQPKNFQEFMVHLQKCKSQDYLRMTDEALELLKWMRQFVDAVDTQGA
ncbi:type III-B CRISPR module-associated protein Cmr5 [Rhodoferax sp.]|uniref:type III-B CRISPR module-associated protein Cmr5 n=1 Tax=Rhodoferax sp. TaxID=50421 RepID=UPI002762530D|nr:type III-B CRISPR module-associated protein Cmr5 [Rhodoferax sp.]